MPGRITLIDAIEGFYVTAILDHLHRLGILKALDRGRTPLAVARDFHFDRDMFICLLDYVSLRSDVISRVGHGKATRYVLGNNSTSEFSSHLLDQYAGAYGPCLLHLPEILTDPTVGQDFVDRIRHAAAFSDSGPAPELFELAAALKLNYIIDIGCGGGQFLTTLARRMPTFRGIGVDANAHMIATARKAASKLRFGSRVKFRHARADEIGRVITEQELSDIRGISAVSVVNAFFGSGGSIDSFFTTLKALFPRRILLLCDYYSRLGSLSRHETGFKRTLVHDVAQLLSSQGLPPKDLREWRHIYARNSVKLLHASKATDQGVCWFIHVVEL